MPSSVQPPGQQARVASTRILLIDADEAHEFLISSALRGDDFRVARLASSHDAGDAIEREAPHAVIIHEKLLPEGGHKDTNSPGISALLGSASGRSIPILALVDGPQDAATITGRLALVDDFVSVRSLGEELHARLARLIVRARQSTTKPVGPADGQFLALMIHDLRTPLNVIGLSLRMVSQAVPKDDPDLEEDLRFLDDNYRQIERMLSLLGDYHRLFEAEAVPGPAEFSPARLIEEVLEARAARIGLRPSAVDLEIEASCPHEVYLDPGRVRLALHYVLANATMAAGGAPIRMTFRGGSVPEQWVVETTIDAAPPGSVHPCTLSPYHFERICGSAGERRGMDLAVAAKVSQEMGGSARLDVCSGVSSTVVLEWPVRMAQVG